MFNISLCWLIRTSLHKPIGSLVLWPNQTKNLFGQTFWIFVGSWIWFKGLFFLTNIEWKAFLTLILKHSTVKNNCLKIPANFCVFFYKRYQVQEPTKIHNFHHKKIVWFGHKTSELIVFFYKYVLINQHNLMLKKRLFNSCQVF